MCIRSELVILSCKNIQSTYIYAHVAQACKWTKLFLYGAKPTNLPLQSSNLWRASFALLTDHSSHLFNWTPLQYCVRRLNFPLLILSIIERLRFSLLCTTFCFFLLCVDDKFICLLFRFAPTKIRMVFAIHLLLSLRRIYSKYMSIQLLHLYGWNKIKWMMVCISQQTLEYIILHTKV